jgi:hypothetical protein
MSNATEPSIATPAAKGCVVATLLLLASMQAQSLEPPPGRQSYWFLVFSDAVAGQEEEYNRWYTEEHGPDVTSIPGFVSAQRYVLAQRQLRAASLAKPKYLIVYTIETSDAEQVRQEIIRRIRAGTTRMSPTITNVEMYSYRAFRPKQKGTGVQPNEARASSLEAYCQIVFGNAAHGKDREFNDWYDRVHEPELLAVPGFVDAQRGILSEVQFAPLDKSSDRSKYLALFDIQTADLQATFRRLKGLTEPVPAFDRARTYGYTYKAINAELNGDAIRAARSNTENDRRETQ